MAAIYQIVSVPNDVTHRKAMFAVRAIKPGTIVLTESQLLQVSIARRLPQIDAIFGGNNKPLSNAVQKTANICKQLQGGVTTAAQITMRKLMQLPHPDVIGMHGGAGCYDRITAALLQQLGVTVERV